MANVPQEWTDTMTQHRAAMVAWDQMRDPAASQMMRDEATVRYQRAADEVMRLMSVMSGTHVLGRITMLLARKDRV